MPANKSINNAPSTVKKALDILEAFVDAGSSMGVTELGQKLKTNKSTVYRILQALLQRGYVNQDDRTNKYLLGYKILRLGGAILGRVPLREIGRANLEALAQETLQTARLAILDREEVVYIEHVEGKDPIRLHLQVGSRGPVYCTAAGKAILAFLPASESNRILSRIRFRSYTPKTITGIRQFQSELEGVKKNGYAITDEEFREEVRAVGAPIFNMDARVVGAMVIVAPAFRMKRKNFPILGQQVKKAALSISEKMGYSP